MFMFENLSNNYIVMALRLVTVVRLYCLFALVYGCMIYIVDGGRLRLFISV